MNCSETILDVNQVTKPYFVWFEDNWVHDDVLHQHEKAQLVYVESGFQYLTVDGKIYLLPQNHAAWIPPNAVHKTNSHSEKIKLMIIFFEVDKKDPFYHQVNVFSVSPVLREMIKYAEKWSLNTNENADENIFLKALYNEIPNFAADSIHLHISLPEDKRLAKAVKFLNNNYTKDLKMEELSDLAALSLRSLERIFKKETGLTLSKYQQILRIIKSLELLSANEWTISEIAYKVGYKSLQAYTNSFQSVMQYRPSDFLKNR
jgi:AraC-like DNA-binding protein